MSKYYLGEKLLTRPFVYVVHYGVKINSDSPPIIHSPIRHNFLLCVPSTNTASADASDLLYGRRFRVRGLDTSIFTFVPRIRGAAQFLHK